MELLVNYLMMPEMNSMAKIYSCFLFNTYEGYPQKFMRGSDIFFLSKEGTTQGDPLGMDMYAVELLPLWRLKNPEKWIQSWYADDSGAAGKLKMLRECFDLFCCWGPKYGHYPETSKMDINC
mmetsp:Transcript_35406/g.45107  ORF Transcript_35406/g.45107 Transcript_35406/m.45107 type:complete len:122 (+) Transcript_35406:179-544(+)